MLQVNPGWLVSPGFALDQGDVRVILLRLRQASQGHQNCVCHLGEFLTGPRVISLSKSTPEPRPVLYLLVNQRRKRLFLLANGTLPQKNPKLQNELAYLPACQPVANFHTLYFAALFTPPHHNPACGAPGLAGNWSASPNGVATWSPGAKLPFRLRSRQARLGDCWSLDAQQVFKLRPTLVIGSKMHVRLTSLSAPRRLRRNNPRDR